MTDESKPLENHWSSLRDIRVFKDIWILGKADCRRVNTKAVILVWIAVSVLPLIVFGTTSYLEDAARIPGDRSGFFEDPVFLCLMLYFPLQFTLMLTYFPSFTSTLHSLRKVVCRVGERPGKTDDTGYDTPNQITADEFNRILETCENWITGRGKLKILKIGAILLGLVWALVAARTHWYWEGSYEYDFWSTRNYPLSFWIRTLFEVVLYGFAFPLFIYKLVTILFSVRHITRKLTKMGVLKLRPLNPDNAGGLGELGNFSLRLSVLLLPPLLPIIAYILFLARNILLVSSISLYIPLLVFTFFFPLSGAHEAMKRFKKKELETLSDAFNQTYDRYLVHLRNDASESFDDMEALKELDELYNRASKMPVWPFDTTTIAKFASILIALFSSLLVSYLQELLDRGQG